VFAISVLLFKKAHTLNKGQLFYRKFLGILNVEISSITCASSMKSSARSHHAFALNLSSELVFSHFMWILLTNE
jgi:hypothetical protein